MSSNVNGNAEALVEIQKTLASINEVTLKIRNELDTINDLVKENSQLQTTVVDANNKLTIVAQKMGINVEDVMSINENGNGLVLTLPNSEVAVSLAEKVISLMDA